MKSLVLALQFMTRIPLPAVHANEADFAGAIRWFAVTGVPVGLCVAGGVFAGRVIDPWCGALGGLLGWVGITGALHLDGLGDVADASGAAHKGRAQLDAMFGDPHVGSFAVVAIAMQLLAKLVLLHAVITHSGTGMDARRLCTVLVLAPMVARIAPMFWARWIAPRHEGLASRFRAGVRWRDILVWSALLALAVWIEPALAAAIPVALAWGVWLARRLGGISGDGHGAGVELTESAILLAAAVLPGGWA